MDKNFDRQMSLSKSKCWYTNNCLCFLKCAVTLEQHICVQLGFNEADTLKSSSILIYSTPQQSFTQQKKKYFKTGASSRHITNLKLSILQTFDIYGLSPLRPIYTWVRFRIRLAHFPKYKNNYILKNGLAYCEIALRNRTCK